LLFRLLNKRQKKQEKLKICILSISVEIFYSNNFRCFDPSTLVLFSDFCYFESSFKLTPNTIDSRYGYTTQTDIDTQTHMCVCVRVCMHAYMYSCMYSCMYACMFEYMYVCMYVRMYAYMHVCTYACMSIHMYVCMNACMYACIYVCKHNPLTHLIALTFQIVSSEH
jgi:hypothetical protein